MCITPDNDWLQKYLQICATCSICEKPYSAIHIPVVLRHCGHVFGYQCLANTLYGGEVDLEEAWCLTHGIDRGSATCPSCDAHVLDSLVEHNARTALERITSDTLVPDHLSKLDAFVEQLREGVATVDLNAERKNLMSFFGACYTSDAVDFLHNALQDAASAGGYFSPFHDIITASRVGKPQVMLFPLIRFCYLLWDVHHTMRRKTSLDINKLLWEGNRCLGLDKPLVQWEEVVEASELDDARLFPLVHCFTMLVSQALVRFNLSEPWKGDDKLEKGRQMALSTVGVHFEGKPSDEWLSKLVIVVNELKRYQFEMGKEPLSGRAAETHIVRGWWSMANM